MSTVCNVALIGQKFMGRAHSNAYLKAARFFNLPITPVMHTIAGLDLISLAPFADRWGWQKYNTNWKDVVKDPAIQLVDISTPNYMHADQAMAALAAGKHVACEKPLANNLKEARQMRNAAVRSRKIKTFVWFNYRRCPAVALAHQLVKQGRIGKIHQVRASYMQEWAGPDTPLTWRFQKKYAGSGAHGDLNAHIIDLTRFVTGLEFTEILGAACATFIPEREAPEAPSKTGGRNPRPVRPGKQKKAKVDVDDATLFIAKLGDHAVGSFEATRLAHGNQNRIGIEVYGERGSLKFDFEDMNLLYFYDAADDRATAGWRRIMCTTAGKHPYAGAWWPDAHLIGYEHTFVNMVADMMASLAGLEPIVPLPDFDDAYEVQRVLEAVTLVARDRGMLKMSEVK